jgi:site-specific DNA-methyltransferase (adenine-specific)
MKPNGHPAEKPIALMDFLVEHAGGEVVMDVFMGSGTTGVAAIGAGRSFIGCEMDPRWFDIACRRIEQAQAQAQLFEPEPPKAEQMELGA